MKLTSPSGSPRRTGSSKSPSRALTTEPGFININKQKVMVSTGAASVNRDNQRVYRLRCNACGHEYGCNGMDIKNRLCPQCQGGAAGEPLPDRGTLSLFD